MLDEATLVRKLLKKFEEKEWNIIFGKNVIPEIFEQELNLGHLVAPLARVSSKTLQCFWRSGFAPCTSHERTPSTNLRLMHTQTLNVKRLEEWANLRVGFI